jgi:hypothetical protein
LRDRRTKSGRKLEDRARKQERFREERRSSGRLLTLVVAAVAVSLFVVGLMMLFGVGGQGAPSSGGAGGVSQAASDAARRTGGAFTVVEPVNDVVKLPVADFVDGQARFYTLRTQTKEIDFFVVRSSDGIIRAAIDSCDVCYAARKGYRQEGDDMVCNNCNQRFPTVRVNEVRGGCNPSPLTRTLEGEEVIIRGSDIIADGDRYF